MATDTCDICGMWYVTMMPINGKCRLCEIREHEWRRHIQSLILDLLADCRHWTAEQAIQAAANVARGIDEL